MEFTAEIIWRAVNSPDGKRLVEIAREHVQLVKELGKSTVSDETREIYMARIQQLKNERDAILKFHEEYWEHAAKG